MVAPRSTRKSARQAAEKVADVTPTKSPVAKKAKTPAAAKTPVAKKAKTPAAKAKTPAATKAKTPAAKAKTPAAKAKTPAATKAKTPAAKAKTPAAKAKTPAAKAKTPAAKAKTPAAAKAKTPAAKSAKKAKVVVEELEPTSMEEDMKEAVEANDSDDEEADKEEDGSDDEMEIVLADDSAAFKATQVVTKKKKSKFALLTKPGSRHGVVYIGHVPHGFYEEQMTGFFTQFGQVVHIRISRSRKSGRSRGYAFVQFVNDEVAKIVCEAMDKYILAGRHLVCEHVPADKVHERMFVGAAVSSKDAKKIPMIRRRTAVRQHNKPRTAAEQLNRANRLVNKQKQNQERMAKMGIEYEFAGYEGSVANLTARAEAEAVSLEASMNAVLAKAEVAVAATEVVSKKRKASAVQNEPVATKKSKGKATPAKKTAPVKATPAKKAASSKTPKKEVTPAKEEVVVEDEEKVVSKKRPASSKSTPAPTPGRSKRVRKAKTPGM